MTVQNIGRPQVSDPNMARFFDALVTTVRRVITLVQPLDTPDAWHPPTFINSWTNYANNYLPGGYTKDALGRVHLRGTIRRTAAGWASLPAFNLPVGYRPAKQVAIATSGFGKHAQVEITATGSLSIVAADSATPESALCLDNISFDTRP